MILAVIIVLLILSALLTLVSYVERVYAEMGKILSREFEENVESYEHRVEPRLGSGSTRVALSMQLLAQLFTAAVALIIGYATFMDGRWSGGEIAQAAVAIVLIIVIFNRLLPYVLFIRTRGDWLVRLIPILKILIWVALPLTIVLGFGMSVASLANAHEPEDPEHPSETVANLLRPVQFVPEMKKVSHLLREMQREKTQMAIVIDEYGGVAGLVTLEDMLEEIVGDIGDEHERPSDVVRESDISYVITGATDLDVLEQVFDSRLHDVEATTVAGLVR